MDYNKYGNKIIYFLLGILGITIISAPIINFLADIQWFKAINYISTFWKAFYIKIYIFIPVSIFFTVIIYLYFSKLSENYKKYFDDEIQNIKGKFNKILIGSLFFGVIFGFSFATAMWKEVLLFLNGGSFGQKDPIFNLDLSFYVFKLPLLKTLLSLLIFVLFWMMLFTTFYFTLVYRKKKNHKENVIDFNQYKKDLSIKDIFCSHSYKSLIRAITTFAVFIMILLGINYFLMPYKLLYSSLGIIYGAGYTDIKITLVAYRLLMVLSFIGAILIVVGYKKGNLKLSLSGPIGLISVHIASLIVALVVQQLIVLPDEINKEKTFINNNLEATRAAYGLDNVDFINYPYEENLSYDIIEEEKEIIDNIIINDHRPLKRTFNEIQGLRMYYKFNDVDVDRYMINDKYTQMFVSPRELTIENLREGSKTWLNKHFKYTHGYGLVMSPVSKILDDGQPELYMKNIPSVSKYGLELKEPRIYFGELTNDYIVVNSDEYEFDYPSGDDNKKTKYKGKAGVSLSGFNKLLFSIKQNSLKLFFSDNINSETKIIYDRNIYERVRKIAPFFEYDRDAYIVLNQEDGKLYWILDGYTMTKNYPYSKPHLFNGKKVNYMRNSVKVVVDAYNGSVDFYKYDDEPIINAYDKIFPDLLKDKSEMPQGLKNHVRYPRDYFYLQALVYESYHVKNPIVFYNGEDVWELSKEKYMTETEMKKTSPKYVTYKLPNSSSVEFLLNVPFTPNEKGNMTAIFAARNDGENYGKLFSYKFPKDKIIKGVAQVENQIDQDSEISSQFTLWSQRGSNVLRGNIIIIPINNSLLYIEPIYLESDNENSLPEMKRVIVYYKDKIVMKKNLSLSLKEIFDFQKENDIIKEGSSLLDERQMEILNEINVILKDYKEDTEKLDSLIEEFNNLNK